MKIEGDEKLSRRKIIWWAKGLMSIFKIYPQTNGPAPGEQFSAVMALLFCLLMFVLMVNEVNIYHVMGELH